MPDIVLPFSEACARNQEPILEVLRNIWTDSANILEIGSGTGQHAVYFTSQMPLLQWQPTETAENLATLLPRIHAAKSPNLAGPFSLDVRDSDWHESICTGVYSANTAHIMSWAAVEAMFQGIGRCLAGEGALVLYGPFNRNGQYSSASNARFDELLRQRDPDSGLRDLFDLETLGAANQLRLEQKCAMPANNLCLVFRHY